MTRENTVSSSDKVQRFRPFKQAEKDKRKKKYDDLQVQGTNNSSIVSKRSVEKLYFPEIQPELGSWFGCFVKDGKKWKRRSPAINRGYWIRMESIRSVLEKILNLNPNKRVNIVNLGCGFDPLPFQMLSSCCCCCGGGGGGNRGSGKCTRDMDLNFVDIDYLELVEEKCKLIRESHEIMSLIGTFSNSKDFKIYTERYKLIGCDLNDLKHYQKVSSVVCTSKDEVNVFIAEVSLAYMKPEFANSVIGISSQAPNSHFILLEQIMPDGPHNAFATKMLYHFQHLRCPIQCVESYPTKHKQVERFRKMYRYAEVKNLFENWHSLVSNEMKSKIMEIEEFDEWEEFILFCQHYVLVHSTNVGGQLVYERDSIDDDLIYKEFEVDEGVSFHLDDRFNKDLLQLKFPAVADLEGKIYINGGLGQKRSGETLEVNYDTGTITLVSPKDVATDTTTCTPSARVCHSLTGINNDELILIGGRTKPGDFKDDIYSFNKKRWEKAGHLDMPRSRHAVVKINDCRLLICGGLKNGNIGNKFVIFDAKSRKISAVNIRGVEVDNLMSSTMTFDEASQTGYLYGGIIDSFVPRVNDKLYKWRIIQQDTGEVAIYIEKVFESVFLSRIGSRATIIKDPVCQELNKLLIVGGVSPSTIFTNSSNIMTLNLTNFELKSVKIGTTSQPPIFIGFGYVELDKKEGNEKQRSKRRRRSSLIISGGAVCYSFGSCYNSVYRIEY
ncbi:PPM2 [Candida oxycetoniae]|uniref:PPM2 n=1 Tax=Candida oxycetoniae TaxID=497107 RepID=A0AAI9WYY4_9ASCO|nr:PPM2 [Candida oxycetoniae]KAI3405335.2 PPM2 [Candida oxycetoniae]